MLIRFYKLFEKFKNSPAKKNKLIIISNICALIINIVLWVFLAIELKKIINLNPQITTIPLHYNVFLGIDMFGKWYKAFLFPLIGSIIFIINFMLAWLLYSKKSLASYFLSLSSLIIQIIFSVCGLLIVLINL